MRRSLILGVVLLLMCGTLVWYATTQRHGKPAQADARTLAKESKPAPRKYSSRDEYVHRAALQIVQLEEAQPDMGGEQFKKRSAELLREDEPLRLEYELIKQERERNRASK
ncbi:MAG: hypothetical protein K2R98_09695 [Gemmataceae bacterium]|nr:hypothetical protein [Gemmataceae bacterium]